MGNDNPDSHSCPNAALLSGSRRPVPGRMATLRSQLSGVALVPAIARDRRGCTERQCLWPSGAAVHVRRRALLGAQADTQPAHARQSRWSALFSCLSGCRSITPQPAPSQSVRLILHGLSTPAVHRLAPSPGIPQPAPSAEICVTAGDAVRLAQCPKGRVVGTAGPVVRLMKPGAGLWVRAPSCAGSFGRVRSCCLGKKAVPHLPAPVLSPRPAPQWQPVRILMRLPSARPAPLFAAAPIRFGIYPSTGIGRSLGLRIRAVPAPCPDTEGLSPSIPRGPFPGTMMMRPPRRAGVKALPRPGKPAHVDADTAAGVPATATVQGNLGG